MKLAFIYYSERAYEDSVGNIYIGGNFPQQVWDRYLSISEELYVIMRRGKKIDADGDSTQSLELVNDIRIHMILLEDVYLSVASFMDRNMKRNNETIIQRTLTKCDGIIIREAHSPIMSYVRQSGKPYLIEVIGDPFSICWNHGIKGKIMAIPEWYKAKKEIKRAKWVIYVTEKYLQKLYPTNGNSAAISDVAIPDINENILKDRLRKIEESDGRFVIGTAAAIDVKYKGQRLVINAMAELVKLGFDFEYQVVGAGKSDKIQKHAKKLGVEDRVKIIGRLSHEKTLEWMKNIDIYINPSFTEGLSRSVVEAASLGVPTLASNVGGNFEILSKKCLFCAGNIDQIKTQLINLDSTRMKKISRESFETCKKYRKENLDNLRNAFFEKYIIHEGLL